MAQDTRFKKESVQLSEEEKAALAEQKTKYQMDPNDFDSEKGESYGGQADIVLIDPGEAAGPFTYIGHQNMTTELGDTTVHLATNEDGNQFRCPIQATFIRAVDTAGLKYGDKFAIKREADVIKKAGKGKGNPIAVYKIKVLERAPVVAKVG